MLVNLLKLWMQKRKMMWAAKEFRNYGRPKKRDKFRKKFSWLYPPWREEFTPKNNYDLVFVPGSKQRITAMAILDLILLQAFALLVFFTYGFKYAQRPDQVGIWTAVFFCMISSFAFYFKGLMKWVVIIAWRLFAGNMRSLLLLILLAVAIERNLGNAIENVQSLSEGAVCVQGKFADTRQKMVQKMQGAMNMLETPELQEKWQNFMRTYKNMGKKIRDQYRSLQSFANSINRMFASLSAVTEKCNGLFEGPSRKCYEVMHDLHTSCHSWDPFGTGVCGGIVHLNKLCDFGSFIGDSFCRFPESAKTWIIDNALGAVMETAKNGIQKLAESPAYHWTLYAVDSLTGIGTIGFDVKLQRRNYTQFRAAKSLIVGNIEAELGGYLSGFAVVQKFLNQVLVWTLVVFVGLSIYAITMYNTHSAAHNIYLTKAFYKLDQARIIDGEGSIFPLIGEEKEKYYSIFSLKTTLLEAAKRLAHVVITIVYGFLPLTFVLIDVSIYQICFVIHWTMQNMKLHVADHFELKAVTPDQDAPSRFPVDAQNLTASPTAETEIPTPTANVTTNFDSNMKVFIDVLMDIFSPMQDAISGKDAAWRDCFPAPTEPNYDLNWAMFLFYLLALVLAFYQFWLQRQWINFADRFFPQRVQPRALYLYNQILEGRREAPAYVRQGQVDAYAQAQLQSKDAMVRRGLHNQGRTVGHCLKCLRRELHLRDRANCHICEGCGTVYCVECFVFTAKCLQCKEPMHEYTKVDFHQVIHFERDPDNLGESDEEIPGILVSPSRTKDEKHSDAELTSGEKSSDQPDGQDKKKKDSNANDQAPKPGGKADHKDGKAARKSSEESTGGQPKKKQLKRK